MAEAVTQVVNQFKAELEGSVETLKNRGQNLGGFVQENVAKVQTRVQEVQPQVQAQIQGVQEQVVPRLQDMGPVPENAHNALLQSHLWAGVCLFALTVGQVIGGSVLSPFIGLIFDAKYSFLLAYLLLPAHYYLQITRGQAGTETDQRLVLLAGSVLAGLLSGYTISDRFFNFFAPPAFVIASLVGVVAGVMGPGFAQNRQTYLGAAVGGAAGVCLVFGLFTGSLGFSFLLYLILSGAAAATVVQLVIGGAIQGNQLAAETAVIAHLTVQFLLSFLLGSSKDAAAASKGGNRQVEDVDDE